MFEIGDSDFADYTALFIDFIASLGFEIEQSYKGSSSVKIDGIVFEIDCKNCSYESTNAYTRNRSVRKPENRFITLKKYFMSSENVVKVQFNKELKSDVLRGKIQAAIDEANADIKASNEKADRDRKNTTEIAEGFFLYDRRLRQVVRSMRVHQSKITFFLSHCSLTIDRDFNFVEYNLNAIEIKDQKSLADLKTDVTRVLNNVDNLIAFIEKHPKPTEEMKQWISSAYERYFDVIKMEYSKY